MYRSYDDLVSSLSTDLTPVVRALKSGLLSKRPRDNYPCGRGVELLSSLYPVLPLWLADHVISVVCPIAQNAVPESLKS